MTLESAAREPEALHYLDLPRARLAWSREGQGPTVIWAHGLLANHSYAERMGIFDWSELARQGHQLIRYDARGHGRSIAAPHADDFTFAALANDLIALTRVVQPRECAVAAIGSSMGTATILHAALQAPSRFSRLVLTAPPTAWETRVAQASLYAEAADRIEREGEPAAQAFLARFPRPRLFADLPSLPREVGLERVPALLRGVGRSDLPAPERLREVRLPALILAWRGDSVHPLATAERLAEVLPNAQLRVADSLEQVRGWKHLAARFLGGLPLAD